MRSAIIFLSAMAAQQAVAHVVPAGWVPKHHPRVRDFPAGVSRGPCPALNVLANEGVLPQNGMDITSDMFKSAIMEVYNLDSGLAGTLANGAISLCGTSGSTSINLADLDKHNAIEHDASLTRNDVILGDNHSMQPALLQAVLDDASGDFVDVDSLAVSRARRGSESQAAGSPSLGLRSTLAYGEAALLLSALGHLGNQTSAAIPKDALQQWIGEERLPDGWTTPPNVISVLGVTALSGQILAKATL